MNRPVTLPDLGLSPVRLSAWFAAVGDRVYEGDRLVEVVAEGATFDVSSPATGRLAERLAESPDVLHPGQTLGTVTEDE